MGFGRRLVRKTVRKATPRPVRRAMHPVRTAKYAVTPRPIREVSRAVYTVTNPLGAAENKLIGAALNSGSRRRASPGRSGASTRSRSAPARQVVGGTGVRAAEAAASHDRLAQLMAVQRERFAAAQRPLVPDPGPVDQKPFQQQEWDRRKGEAHIWQRARRRQLRAEAAEYGQAHVTPTGRLSSRVWTKTELNQVYAQLQGAHLLATIREAWAVAPSLTNTGAVARSCRRRRVTTARVPGKLTVVAWTVTISC